MALILSSVLYLASAILALVAVLALDPPIALLDRDWSGLERFVFVGAFMFPAISVMALIGGWVMFASERYTGALIAALFPWLWGSAVVFIAFAEAIARQ